MNKICLVVIYNHNFEENINKIEELYNGKFDSIYHLMPFYSGNKDNVIKIYGSSYQFQDYIHQGIDRFANDNYSHYVFIADDMILNPSFNQDNILNKLNLDDDSGFIPTIHSVGYETFFYWNWAFSSIRAMECNPGCQYINFLPPFDDAVKRFEMHNIACNNITKEGFKKISPYFVKDEENYCKYRNSNKLIFKRLFYKILQSVERPIKTFNDSPLPYYFSKNRKSCFEASVYSALENKAISKDFVYPIAFTFSDFFIIPAKKIKQFSDMCSILASARVFVEVAIPTAMILTLNKIVLEKDIDYKLHVFNKQKDLLDFCNYNEYSLDKLFKQWDEKDIFIHPIKLSKWK